MPDEWPHLRSEQPVEQSRTGPTAQPSPSIDEQWEDKAAELLKGHQAASEAARIQAASPGGTPGGWAGVQDSLIDKALAQPHMQAAQPVIDVTLPEETVMRWMIDCNPTQFDVTRLNKTMLLLAKRFPKPKPIMNAAMECVAGKKNVIMAQEVIQKSGENSRQTYDMVNAYLVAKGK